MHLLNWKNVEIDTGKAVLRWIVLHLLFMWRRYAAYTARRKTSISRGHEVSIITGRPSSVYEPSRIWLDEHGLKDARLYCLNKYGRNFFLKNSNSTLELEDYYRMKFDYAVEDSPKAFRYFEHLPELKVLVFDRPWNRECSFPNGNYQRCADWESIRKIVENSTKRSEAERTQPVDHHEDGQGREIHHGLRREQSDREDLIR